MSPDQVEAIIRKLLEQGVTLNAASYLAIVILSALFAVAGGFFASYLGEKGKNRATREDFDKLTEQLKQTTRVAEDIKAQVSNESWLRQQIWAEKRRLYAEILQAFEDVRYAASGMSHFHRLMQKQEEEKTKEMLLTQVASHGES